MPLNPADYRVEWDKIKPGIVESLKHQHEGLRPEDVYFDLRSGRAVLYTCDDGFLVLKEAANEADGTKDLFIWLAYSHAKVPIIEKYAAEVDQIARGAGLVGIQFVSTRRGYERALPDGWEPMHTRWRRRLP